MSSSAVSSRYRCSEAQASWKCREQADGVEELQTAREKLCVGVGDREMRPRAAASRGTGS